VCTVLVCTILFGSEMPFEWANPTRKQLYWTHVSDVLSCRCRWQPLQVFGAVCRVTGIQRASALPLDCLQCCPIWAPIPKMGLEWYCISLQQSTYMRDSFWVTAKAQPKYKYHLSCRLICRNCSLLGPVVGEDQK